MSNLLKDENYLITLIKKLNTKYGVKVVLELNGQWQFFVPKRVNDAIINDEGLFEYLRENVQKLQMYMRYISATGGLKFVR